MIKYWSK